MDDSELATLFIFASALLHAVWNAALKSIDDRQAAIGVFNIFGAVASAPLLAFMAYPSTTEWVWIFGSVTVHMLYQLSLAKMMGTANYSLVYPISRGLGPLVVTVIAVSLLGETLSALQLIAILTIIAGTITTGMAGSRGNLKQTNLTALLWTLVVGTLIGTYTLIDGSAVKDMEPLQFLLWSNVIIMPPMMMTLCYQNGTDLFKRMKRVWPRASMMTIVAYGGYTLALMAFSLGNLAKTAALRETSILFAAIIGVIWLKERMTLLHAIGIFFIGLGAIALKVS